MLLVLVAEQPVNTALSDQAPVEPARLGLVVGKKHLKKAVDRNRFKRLVRESFRHHQEQLKGLDIIVLARGAAKQAIAGESESDNREIATLLDKAWRYIDRKRG